MLPPNGYAEIVTRFGDPSRYRLRDGTLDPKWEHDNITRVALPLPMRYVEGGTVTRVAVHRLVAGVVAATLLEASRFPEYWQELQPYGGGYESRRQAGSTRQSLHTWGLALDFNPARYPLGGDARFPGGLVQIFTSRDWTYGGDFVTRSDPMHFQFASGF